MYDLDRLKKTAKTLGYELTTDTDNPGIYSTDENGVTVLVATWDEVREDFKKMTGSCDDENI